MGMHLSLYHSSSKTQPAHPAATTCSPTTKLSGISHTKAKHPNLNNNDRALNLISIIANTLPYLTLSIHLTPAPIRPSIHPPSTIHHPGQKEAKPPSLPPLLYLRASTKSSQLLYKKEPHSFSIPPHSSKNMEIVKLPFRKTSMPYAPRLQETPNHSCPVTMRARPFHSFAFPLALCSNCKLVRLLYSLARLLRKIGNAIKHAA